ALAIHDTSSVVGAAASYGDQALAEATVLKLARAMWIVPLVVGFWMVRRGENSAKGPLAWPLFVGLFVLAAAARSALPSMEFAFDSAAWLAQRGLVLVLFVIGSGMTRELLGQVGWRPLSFALILWFLVSSLTLGLVIYCPSIAP
ncbi:MAG: putative sulfate exporter family transporter, partial [Wenzhouxiangella sp.]|nr:putative sulfate exporter family transporter [Wenzhouxiangella sp.]